MAFRDRAVDLLAREMNAGMIVETHLRDVLKCRDVDVSWASQFLRSDNEQVRLAAARLVAEKGEIELLVIAAVTEEDRDVLLSMLQVLGRKGAGVEALEGLLASEDTVLRDAAVDMFRRAGKLESLFALIFNEDDNIVKRIKRYINEAGFCGETSGS